MKVNGLFKVYIRSVYMFLKALRSSDELFLEISGDFSGDLQALTECTFLEDFRM
jgi:hypothetical protein